MVLLDRTTQIPVREKSMVGHTLRKSDNLKVLSSKSTGKENAGRPKYIWRRDLETEMHYMGRT